MADGAVIDGTADKTNKTKKLLKGKDEKSAGSG